MKSIVNKLSAEFVIKNEWYSCGINHKMHGSMGKARNISLKYTWKKYTKKVYQIPENYLTERAFRLIWLSR